MQCDHFRDHLYAYAKDFQEDQRTVIAKRLGHLQTGGLLIEGAEKVIVENCDFDSSGGNAVFINNYNRYITISGNHIHGADASGVNVVGSPKAV